MQPSRDTQGTSAQGEFGVVRGVLVGLGLVLPVWLVALAWLVSCQIDGPQDCGGLAGGDATGKSVAAAKMDRTEC